ncbi:MAG: hypothetical protein CL910_00045 [Deltaproteobacteria bacterium]|nr:hypothetical protein [Deltaproteobacteria bacterium]
MLPEGTSGQERWPVAVLVDATRPGCARRLFGMALVERVLRALLEAGLEGVRVWLHEAGDASAVLPDDLWERLDLVPEPGEAPLAKRVTAAASRAEALLVLEGDAVIDPRLIRHLAASRGARALSADAPEPGCGSASAVLRLEGAPGEAPPSATLAELADEWVGSGSLAAGSLGAVPSHIQKLRRDLPAYVFRVTDDAERDGSERFLFRSNYKGSTDFLTKHVYPPLVWRMLQPLARRRIHPNWVSGFNVLITFAAIPLFAAGAWVAGLTLAYTMSVLDSVDGKLARLTYRSSKLGHVLDHGLDVVHPPLWYLAWAVGLGGGLWLDAVWWMTGAYVADRLVTEAFTRMTSGRSIHAWAPVDVRMRTFISRRNINLPLFTAGLLVGLPGPALLVVVAWQVATLAFHALRLAQVARDLRNPRGAA